MNFTKETANPLFWIGILLLVIIAYVYFMNEGYVDASGATITLSFSDLVKALSFANKGATPEEILKSSKLTPPISKPTEKESDEKTVLDKETENRLSKNIATQIKDELLAQRATTPPSDGCSSSSCAQDTCNSNSCAQGSDYLANSPGAPFNSNDYIRKDSIPCWGCTLPQ